MLFNSYPFLLVFLPIVLAGYQIAGRFHRKAVVSWLGFMSLVFYAYWRPPIVFLLIGSIALNYIAASLISRHIPNKVNPRVWMWGAIAANLAALGYFKYLFTWLNTWSYVLATPHHWDNVILPLGISFFTFTQIAYLVDLYQGTATQQDLSSYVLFVTFFPHLIAGPILHHKEMMPQFQQNRRYQLRREDLAVGFSWFIMGLAKKVMLADLFAQTADLAYTATAPLPMILAWRGVLCYALQLYFDFSGYSDMALGLARMFSINFPLNFSSPYKATNIIDFWQRWHITLTQYITAYVYSPVQFWISARRQAAGKKVSRKAQATPEGFAAMIAFPTLFTMFVAGVWHGAGLQFLIFGLLHGVYLTVNHGWRLFRHKAQKAVTAEPGPARRGLNHAASVLLTLGCVLVAQTFFRASSSRHALSILNGMVGGHGLGSRVFSGEGGPGWASLHTFGIVIGFGIVWFMPNTQQILRRFKPSLEITPWDEVIRPAAPEWLPSAGWAVGIALLLFISLVRMQSATTFLYFQF